MIVIILILVIIIFILLMPIGIRFIYNDNRSDVDLFFYKIFNARFDLDKFIRFFLSTKEDRFKVTFESIKYNIKGFREGKKIIKGIVKSSRIKKITVLLKDDYKNFTTFFLYWIIINFLSSQLYTTFKSVQNEYYMTSKMKKEISFEIVVNVNLINIVIIIIKNFTDFIKMVKYFKKGN